MPVIRWKFGDVKPVVRGSVGANATLSSQSMLQRVLCGAAFYAETFRRHDAVGLSSPESCPVPIAQRWSKMTVRCGDRSTPLF